MLSYRENPWGQLMIFVVLFALWWGLMFSMPDSSQAIRGQEVQFAVPSLAERGSCLGFLVCWLFLTPHTLLGKCSPFSVQVSRVGTVEMYLWSKTWWITGLCWLMVLSHHMFRCALGVPLQVRSLRPLWPLLRGFFVWVVFTERHKIAAV